MVALSTQNESPLSITTERIDDIPLLVKQMEQMGLPILLDKHFPTHGNWGGLSFGWVASLWCSHVLSEADHRMNHVQPWAESKLLLLNSCTEQEVTPLDLCDDRLAQIIRQFSDDEKWYAFEDALNQNVVRVYNLDEKLVRLDSTTTYGYWGVTEEGLFQFGHSKDKRPDLPQLKVMLSSLDPWGFPLVTTIVSGEKADDPLYVPAVKRVRESLQRRGLLYLGDSKMAALDTRAFIAEGKDYYLSPLPKVQVSAQLFEEYLQAALTGEQELTPVFGKDPDGQPLEDEEGCPVKIAEVYEVIEPIEAKVHGQEIKWKERRLVMRSLARANSEERKLRRQLQRGVEELTELKERKQGKKVYRELGDLLEKVESIVKARRIEGLVDVHYIEEVTEHHIRGYKGRPARIEREYSFTLTVTVNQEALEASIQRLGWRVLATNAPVSILSSEQAVLAYRNNVPIEVNNFRRLKNKPLSLHPMYVQRSDHAIGLVRLLSLCLRTLVLLEVSVHRALQESGTPLQEVYKGNPKRKTMRPGTELLLSAFKGLTLTIVEGHEFKQYHITPLSAPQKRILALLGFSCELYETFEDKPCRSPTSHEIAA